MSPSLNRMIIPTAWIQTVDENEAVASEVSCGRFFPPHGVSGDLLTLFCELLEECIPLAGMVTPILSNPAPTVRSLKTFGTMSLNIPFSERTKPYTTNLKASWRRRQNAPRGSHPATAKAESHSSLDFARYEHITPCDLQSDGRFGLAQLARIRSAATNDHHIWR